MRTLGAYAFIASSATRHRARLRARTSLSSLFQPFLGLLERLRIETVLVASRCGRLRRWRLRGSHGTATHWSVRNDTTIRQMIVMEFDRLRCPSPRGLPAVKGRMTFRSTSSSTGSFVCQSGSHNAASINAIDARLVQPTSEPRNRNRPPQSAEGGRATSAKPAARTKPVAADLGQIAEQFALLLLASPEAVDLLAAELQRRLELSGARKGCPCCDGVASLPNTVAGPLDDEALVSLEVAKQISGLGKTQIYALIRKRKFPAPYKPGGAATRWSLGELRAWRRELKPAS